MSELVGDGEGERQSGVLVDVTAAMRLTQTRHLRQTQRTARLVQPRTDVVPENVTAPSSMYATFDLVTQMKSIPLTSKNRRSAAVWQPRYTALHMDEHRT